MNRLAVSIGAILGAVATIWTAGELSPTAVSFAAGVALTSLFVK